MTYDTDTDTGTDTATDTDAATGSGGDAVALDGAARGLTRRDETKPDGRRLSLYSLGEGR